MARKLDNDVQITIRSMRTGGFTTNQIAHSLGLSKSTVSKYCLIINEERGHRRAYTRTSSTVTGKLVSDSIGE
jgi:predicted transcriptional regulator